MPLPSLRSSSLVASRAAEKTVPPAPSFPGVAQTLEELLEFGLLLLKAPQGIHAVFVERAVAARVPIAAPAPSLGCTLHPFHALLHSLHASLPAVTAAMCPTCHSSTPYEIPEKHQTERPE